MEKIDAPKVSRRPVDGGCRLRLSVGRPRSPFYYLTQLKIASIAHMGQQIVGVAVVRGLEIFYRVLAKTMMIWEIHLGFLKFIVRFIKGVLGILSRFISL